MRYPYIIGFTVLLFLLSCSSDDNSSTGTTTNPLPLGTTKPALTAADKDSVAPCPNQAIFADATELAALKDALLTGTLSFLDVPFNGADADNFKKKCGFETFWDPANNSNEVASSILGGPVTLSSLLLNGNAGICTANSSPMNFITGMPAAGTYRGEIKAAKGGSTWHLRMRGTVSGSSAGNTFLSEAISVPADIENTLEYKVNGVVTTHNNLLAAIVGAANTAGDPILFEVASTTGGATVLSISIELICVTRS